MDVPGPPTYQEVISKPIHFDEAFKPFNVGATRFPAINKVMHVAYINFLITEKCIFYYNQIMLYLSFFKSIHVTNKGMIFVSGSWWTSWVRQLFNKIFVVFS